MPPETRQGRPRVKDAINYVSKGIADNYLLLEEEGYCEQAVNVIIDSSKRTRPHPGTQLINRRGVRLPSRVAGRNPIDALYSFGDKFLLAISNGFLYEYDQGADFFRRIIALGELGNPIFPVGRDYTFAEINNEVVIASGALERPFLLYIDTEQNPSRPNGHYLGLPEPKLSGADTKKPDDRSADTYLYAFHFSREYRSSGYRKIDLGDVVYIEQPQIMGDVSFTFPHDMQDVVKLHGNLKLQVYRTQLNGTGLYKVEEVNYDQDSDDDLVITNELGPRTART